MKPVPAPHAAEAGAERGRALLADRARSIVSRGVSKAWARLRPGGDTAELAPDTTIDMDARLERVRAAVAADRKLAKLYEQVIADLPWPRLEEMIARWGAHSGFEGRLKYLDSAFWLRHKLVAARRLGLDAGPPRRILDIGMGCGHFSYVCERLGHGVVGVDLADPFYEEVCAALGVRRVTHRVTAERPVPDLGRFDLVTAFASQFDLWDGVYWSVDDWRGAIGTLLAEHMNPGARLHFRVNPLWNASKGRQEPKAYLRAVATRFNGTFKRGSTLDIVRR